MHIQNGGGTNAAGLQRNLGVSRRSLSGNSNFRFGARTPLHGWIATVGKLASRAGVKEVRRDSVRPIPDIAISSEVDMAVSALLEVRPLHPFGLPALGA
jgi:hypothetical protein